MNQLCRAAPVNLARPLSIAMKLPRVGLNLARRLTPVWRHPAVSDAAETRTLILKII
jgi:hypothetical protein